NTAATGAPITTAAASHSGPSKRAPGTFSGYRRSFGYAGPFTYHSAISGRADTPAATSVTRTAGAVASAATTTAADAPTRVTARVTGRAIAVATATAAHPAHSSHDPAVRVA